MQNSLNNTQSAPDTGNPQTAAENNGASNSADFQKTAPVDALNEQNQELAVQQTGEPLPVTSLASASNATLWFWGLGLVLVIAVVIAGVKLLWTAVEAEEVVSPSKAEAAKPAKSAKPAKKTTAKSKAKPAAKKRKKASKKRR